MNQDTSYWRKSSYSGAENACVELRLTDDQTAVRDTKNRQGGSLAFTSAAFRAFVAVAKAGQVSLPVA
jgi:hypothetical protein